jgi:hypothetical protein
MVEEALRLAEKTHSRRTKPWTEVIHDEIQAQNHREIKEKCTCPAEIYAC